MPKPRYSAEVGGWVSRFQSGCTEASGQSITKLW